MLGEHNWTENLKTTRQYLTKGFQGFMMTEDSSGGKTLGDLLFMETLGAKCVNRKGS
jgi:hypothetical protein